METTHEITLYVKGMDCAECARTVQNGVSQMNGVSACSLNFATEKMVVQGNLDQETILKRIRELGYDAEDGSSQNTVSTKQENFLKYLWKQTETRLALAGVMFILPGLIFEEFLGVQHTLIVIASLIALVLAGYPIAISAWKALRYNHEITINSLMTIAAAGAVAIGATTEAGMVMVLFAIGEALEGYTAERARQSIRSLMTIVPEVAVRLDSNGQEQLVPVNDLQIGDTILVKPGERIPMDGTVFSGESLVNQAPITGESRLIGKATGDEVFASTINGEGTLKITINRRSENSTISRMIKLVEDAQEKRAPAQRFVDRFARIYTPVVVVIATLTAIIPPLFFHQPFLNPQPEVTGWLYRGLALLVIACPCALVISTPVTIISAISAAARSGILIKGGAYLEQLNHIRAVAFDKTGTLTEGKPSVASIITFRDWNSTSEPVEACRDDSIRQHNQHPVQPDENCSDLIALTHAVERYSEHPLAHAIAQEALLRGVAEKYPPAESVTAIPGNGVRGIVNGYTVLIGSHKYFEANVPHSQEYCAIAEEEAMKGYTPLMVAANGKYIGILSVADSVRPDNRTVMKQLSQSGVRHLVMLTGDNQSAARQVAENAGMSDVYPELLPQEKVAILQEYSEKHGSTAMVGDGINDAPVLASSTVGIAVGGNGGSAQAMETADITLMNGNLTHLPFLFQLSHTTMRTIYTNVLFALGIKLLFLILVLAGSGTMWMAVTADVGASLLVTLNGMRMLRQKPEYQ